MSPAVTLFGLYTAISIVLGFFLLPATFRAHKQLGIDRGTFEYWTMIGTTFIFAPAIAVIAFVVMLIQKRAASKSAPHEGSNGIGSRIANHPVSRTRQKTSHFISSSEVSTK